MNGSPSGGVPVRTPTCVWRLSDELLVALDDRFSLPNDAYVNGSQVWLRDDGPKGETLEWRLHPVSSYRKPKGIGVDEIFETVAQAIREGTEPFATPAALWDGLEAFPGFGDDIEPALLANACAEALGIAPDAFGLVDHTTIGDRWEQTSGSISIVAALFNELTGDTPDA